MLQAGAKSSTVFRKDAGYFFALVFPVGSRRRVVIPFS